MMQSPSLNQIPLWIEIVKTLTAPLIAAAFVVIGLLWRDRIERRDSAQAWYEQYHITEGIDRLTAHFLSLKSLLESYEQPELPTRTDREPIPFEADSRIRVLLQDWTFHVSALYAHDTIRQLEYVRSKTPRRLKEDFPQQQLKKILAFTKEVTDVTLPLLRERLLSIKIHQKIDIYTIKNNVGIKSMLGVVKESLLKHFPEPSSADANG